MVRGGVSHKGKRREMHPSVPCFQWFHAAAVVHLLRTTAAACRWLAG